ncbi:MAG: hypothetical protein ACK2UW_23930 [Anaerolineales bacterium]|jgi:hypothetical protein
MKTKIQVLQILIGFLLIFLMAGCASETPVLTTTIPTFAPTLPPAPTSTPTATKTATVAPTATPTPTLPPTATPTITPIPLNEDAALYYPLKENATWWFQIILNERIVGFSGFSVLGQDNLNGREVYIIENIESGRFKSRDYQEVSSDWLLLHRYTMEPIQGEASDVVFQPPIPILQFPIEVGVNWEDENGFTYEIVGIEDVSVPAGDFKDCYRVDRSFQGTPDIRSWYCDGIGRALFEQLSSQGWMRLELISYKNARVILEEAKGNGEQCSYRFSGAGFAESEPVTFQVIHQNGSILFDTETLGLPMDSGDVFSFDVGPEVPLGYLVVKLDGLENSAVYILYWNAECLAY